MPVSPQKAAGPRVDPPPSEADAIDVMAAATLAPAPPLEPPGMRVRSHGLLQVGAIFVYVSPKLPNSGVADLPTMTAPEARIRSTTAES